MGIAAKQCPLPSPVDVFIELLRPITRSEVKHLLLVLLRMMDVEAKDDLDSNLYHVSFYTVW
ncbi:hypothetical protein OUZ56_005187 [Daphnia magna]|uniref:Uncharacterized protein n=1 Tax=Daphnia magna TaxID=35525 RepID=A0ABQ9YS27_9CRUS|nr:hypothetical protein OUZ56_005187 [Daphnia magna]